MKYQNQQGLQNRIPKDDRCKCQTYVRKCGENILQNCAPKVIPEDDVVRRWKQKGSAEQSEGELMEI